MAAAPTFSSLVQQLQADLSHAVDVCEEIRKNRHIGSSHKQLDDLQDSLSAGPSFVADQAPKSDSSGDEVAQSELSGYIDAVKEINDRLEHTARPHTHHHHSHGHHSPSSTTHHREIEDPHFHDLRLKWEGIRAGIGQTFEQLKLRGEEKTGEEKTGEVDVAGTGSDPNAEIKSGEPKEEHKEEEKESQPEAPKETDPVHARNETPELSPKSLPVPEGDDPEAAPLSLSEQDSHESEVTPTSDQDVHQDVVSGHVKGADGDGHHHHHHQHQGRGKGKGHAHGHSHAKAKETVDVRVVELRPAADPTEE